MKRQIRQVVVMFFSLGLFGIVVGPVKAQEGQGDSWSDLTSRLAEVFGAQTNEAVAQGEALAQEEGGTASNVTTSQVFQATLDMIAEIEILREGMAVVDYPGEADPQEGRSPVHTYAKALEAMEKVARAQRKLGMIPVDPGLIPVKHITTADVMREVQTILEELRKMKSQLVIEESIDPAPLVNGKTPSLVYKNLGDASLLLNALVGRPMTPNDTFGHLEHVYDDMELIAANLQVSLNRELPTVEGRKSSGDVARLILRSSYKIIDLQNRLGMDASHVPQLAMVRVTPAENFEVTNILLAELNRIKAHLNIDLPHDAHPIPRNKRPADVFAHVVRILRNMDILADAAAAATTAPEERSSR